MRPRLPRRPGFRLLGDGLEQLERRHVLAAALDLNFATNGLAADTPPGPSIRFGDAVPWTYQVSNAGNVPLNNVRVVDDGGTPTDTHDDFSPTPVLAAAVARGTLETTFNLNVAR